MTYRPLLIQGIALLLGLVLLLGGTACESTPETSGPEPEPYTLSDADEAFLDTVEARTFQWFWDVTDPETGLVPDRWPRRTFSSVAAIGFGLTAYGIGAERGYVTREEVAERVLTTLRYLWEAPQSDHPIHATGYRGFFYHFLEYDNGLRYRNVELSTIDTALLMAGVLFNQEYFDRETEQEAEIRALADSLYHRVEWDWFRARPPLITMAWHPDVGFGRARYEGFNEAMILYILALGSPTYPIGPEVWDAWTSTYLWGDFYGYEHVQFTPLFGHQYSHVWIDFRGIQDDYMRERGIDYFENSRRATYAQRAYAIDNPAGWKDYGEDIWGLTACDGPAGVQKEYNGEMRRFHTYWARGASLDHINDDGTIAPTAVGGSVPFAPEICIPALQAMRARYGAALFTEYGFLDAFNPSFTFTDVELGHGQIEPDLGWFDGDYLGIDQGPILAMIENYRSGLVWETMKHSPYIVRGLKRAGFTGGWLDDHPDPEPIPTRTEIPAEFDEAEATVIVVLGSSTAEGVGPQHAENTWVNRYRTYAQSVDSSLRVVNLARGGYTTYHLLPTGMTTPEGRPQPDTLRNITATLNRNPAAIIINLPSNDTAGGHTVEEQLQNYDTIMAEAEAAGVPVWITTTQPRNLDEQGRQDLMALRDSTVARYGDHAIDVWTGIARDDGRLDPAHDSGDNLHLNDAAHGLLFERVRSAGILETIRPPNNR